MRTFIGSILDISKPTDKSFVTGEIIVDLVAHKDVYDDKERLSGREFIDSLLGIFSVVCCISPWTNKNSAWSERQRVDFVDMHPYFIDDSGPKQGMCLGYKFILEPGQLTACQRYAYEKRIMALVHVLKGPLCAKLLVSNMRAQITTSKLLASVF